MDFGKTMTTELGKRLVALLILVVVLFGLRSMLNLLLLTFVMTFLFYRIQNFVFEHVSRVIPVNKKIVTVGMYGIIISGIGLFFYRYIPVIIRQLMAVSYQIAEFDMNNLRGMFSDEIMVLFQGVNVESYLKEGGNYLFQLVTHVGKFSLNLFVAFILSVFFMIEKDEIKHCVRGLQNSRVGFLYDIYRQFGRGFLNSFGKVLSTQVIIAAVNAALSAIALFIMGFPQILGLAFMIFFLGMIPVAGVIISLVPLSIIAFKIGGITEIFYVLIMIALLHALESYVLNPKLMSKRIKLPVFFTFIILIVSEHFLGVWGLLVGLPLFTFVMDLLRDQDTASPTVKNEAAA